MFRYLFLCLILIPSEVLVPQQIKKTFNSVCFTDTLNGWIGGVEGIIINTTDGGNHWNMQTSGTTTDIQQIRFFNKNSGWAVGGKGLLLHTTNGGSVWNKINRDTSENYFKVFPTTDSTCYFTSERYLLFASSHGKYLRRSPSPQDHYLEGLFFNDNVFGFIASHHYVSPFVYGTLWHTIDSGKSFSKVFSSNNLWFMDVFFIGNKGWSAGFPGSQHFTTDGGKYWYPMSPISNDWFSKITFADTLHGLIQHWKGGSVSNTILRSSDGGYSWSYNMDSGSINDISLVNYFNGWMVGYNGLVLFSNNGMLNWANKNIVLSASEEIILTKYFLEQNYPNPFNPATTITFEIGKPGMVELNVYDVLGKKAANLISEFRPYGKYTVGFNGSGLPSGVYICRLSAGGYTSSIKMLLIK